MQEGMSTRMHSHTMLVIAYFTASAVCRTGTYFCVDKSVTSVVIKVTALHNSSVASHFSQKSDHFHRVGASHPMMPSMALSSAFCCRVWQNTEMSWVRHSAHADITMTRRQKQNKDSGIALVCPCENARYMPTCTSMITPPVST